MTDNEIIQALENCMNGGACVNCPYQGQCETGILAEVAVDLIKRQQAEIERLNKLVLELNSLLWQKIEKRFGRRYKALSKKKGKAK